MLNSSQLALVGLARTRLPVPTAKLAVIHGVARTLGNSDAAPAVWTGLLQWIASLDLESEVAEALCIVMLARESAIVSYGELRSAIRRPSVLSELLISKAAGSPTVVNTWALAHSGEVPPFLSSAGALEELEGGYTVPRILSSRMRALEQQSGRPFLKQWGFEFQRLLDRLGPQADGHWLYADGEEPQLSVGRFVARRSHVARSAFLRTLALAVDAWGMPDARARDECLHAAPADLAMLHMSPGASPTWWTPLGTQRPVSEQDLNQFVAGLAPPLGAGVPTLLHLNATLSGDETYQADVELVSVLHAGERPTPEEAFRMHEFLPGRATIKRKGRDALELASWPSSQRFEIERGGELLPALLPCFGEVVGYVHADLIERLPYAPVHYASASESPAIARPRPGGADIIQGDDKLGELHYWNWQWTPRHHPSLGPKCGVATTINHDRVEQLLGVAGMHLIRVWKATVMRRERAFAEWQTEISHGVAP